MWIVHELYVWLICAWLAAYVHYGRQYNSRGRVLQYCCCWTQACMYVFGPAAIATARKCRRPSIVGAIREFRSGNIGFFTGGCLGLRWVALPPGSVCRRNWRIRCVATKIKIGAHRTLVSASLGWGTCDRHLRIRWHLQTCDCLGSRQPKPSAQHQANKWDGSMHRVEPILVARLANTIMPTMATEVKRVSNSSLGTYCTTTMIRSCLYPTSYNYLLVDAVTSMVKS